MSTKKIDELFRSKLADHAATPGADAWARLQGKMNPPQNNRAFFWMPIAAAVALLIFAGWLVFRQSDNSGGMNETLAEQAITAQPALADSSSISDQTNKIQEPQLSVNSPEPAPAEQVTPAKKKIQRTVQPAPMLAASDEQSNRQNIAQAPIDTSTPKTNNTMVDVPELVDVNETAKEQVAQADNVAETPIETPEVKITFIADDDERFLQPVKDLIASEAAKEKKNGFGKLIASARTLSNRDILAELRDSKDDLFNGNVRLGIIKNEKGQ